MSLHFQLQTYKGEPTNMSCILVFFLDFIKYVRLYT